MIADIGTSGGKSINDVDQSSVWINGYSWMRKSRDEMPIQSVNEILLNHDEMDEVKKEVPCKVPETHTIHSIQIVPGRKLPEKINERYTFSNYVIDPNKHRFKVIVHIVAIIMKFINNTRNKVRTTNQLHPKKNKLFLFEQEIKNAENYFFRKTTEEVKHF